MSSTKFAGGDPYNVECPAEQLIAEVLDLDPEVRGFVPQALTVDLIRGDLLFSPEAYRAARAQYRDEPGPCLYTGDFCVYFTSGTKGLLEVRLDAYPGDDVYLEKIERAKVVLARFGYEFSRVVVPADGEHPMWSNVPLVTDGARRKDLWPHADVLQRIEALHCAGARLARDYLSDLGWDKDHLPVLIACGALRADVIGNQHLGLDTLVEAGFSDLEHLRLPHRLAQ
jgi:hypothetical protein